MALIALETELDIQSVFSLLSILIFYKLHTFSFPEDLYNGNQHKQTNAILLLAARRPPAAAPIGLFCPQL